MTLLNEDDKNLLLNSSYVAEAIVVLNDERKLNPEQVASDSIIRFFIRAKKGGNTYLIHLNETKTDTLALNLSMEGFKGNCCSPRVNFNSGTYNKVSRDIVNNGFCSGEMVVIK